MDQSARVRFGRTNLLVSPLCQGTAFRHLPRADDPRGLQVLRHCLEVGVNFFDSSNAYGWGGAEKVLGKAIAGRREEIVICTKIAPNLPPQHEGDEAPSTRFSREFVFAQAEGSLGRLGTDYIDLYLLHSPDRQTPPEEIVETMEALVQTGKIRYWGASNHSAAQVEAFVDLGAPIAGIEEYYNIAGQYSGAEGCNRMIRLEEEMFPVVRRVGLGVLAFSPVDAGHLVPGFPLEPGSPLAALTGVLDEVAQDLGMPRTALCVAWVLAHAEVSNVLAGAESPEHVEANWRGAQLVLSDEVRAVLDEACLIFREQVRASEAD